jgi:hypothetical protein
VEFSLEFPDFLSDDIPPIFLDFPREFRPISGIPTENPRKSAEYRRNSGDFNGANQHCILNK